MGCGQSHIAVIYPRKGKAKNSGSGSAPFPRYMKISPNSCEPFLRDHNFNKTFVKQGGGSGEESDDEGDAGGGGAGRGGAGAGRGGAGAGEVLGGAATNPAAEESPPTSETEEEQRLRIQISSSPLLAQAELSTSQAEFFKMLDDKINNGPDYEPPSEYEFAMDEAQLCRLLQEWQAAKLRSRCGLRDGALPHSRNPAPPKLQRYHSLQSNGEPPGGGQRKLHHQMSTSYGPQYYGGYYQPQPPPPPPPPHPHYQYHPHPQPPPLPPAHWGALPANSVVMYDKRGGYYTELA